MIIVIRDGQKQSIIEGIPTYQMLEKVRKVIGLRKMPSVVRGRFSETDDEYILKHYGHKGHSATKIAEYLTKKNGRKFTKNMVISHWNRVLK